MRNVIISLKLYRKRGRKMTPTRQRVYDFYLDYWIAHDCAPTLMECGNALGLHNTTVFEHIEALEEMGLFSFDPKKARRRIRVVAYDLEKQQEQKRSA